MVSSGDRSSTLDVIGLKVIVLVPETASQTQKITLKSGEEGAGPPPHSHTRGEVQFACGGKTTKCSTGTLLHVPSGTVHSFSFGPGGGEMLEVTGANSQAIPMFSALAREIPPGPSMNLGVRLI